METLNFGEHLTLDGYGGDYKKLNDEKNVLDCLNELPELLGMQKLAKPEIYHADDNEIKDPGGWTGMVIIKESHISIHTFPARKFVSADVYTCRNEMDCNFIVDYFKKKFNLSDVETNFIKRGTKYPAQNIN
jgi:S-adenosylmethionine decarboxylase